MTEFEMFLFVVGVATGLAMATIVHIELGKRRRDDERRRLLDIWTRATPDAEPMPWCERCECYHHHTAPHIKRSRTTPA